MRVMVEVRFRLKVLGLHTDVAREKSRAKTNRKG